MDEAQFQQLLNAVLAAQANVQPAPPVPPPAAPFALTPGQANPTQPLDYTSTIGIKIWNEATASLPLKFNVEGKEVNQFCRDLQVRAKQQGWDATGADIITIAADANAAYNVITEYGRLTVEQITTAAQTYVADQTRQAQNNEQMLHCIDNSLTKEGKLKILAEQDKYTVTVGGVKYESATLLLKLLMQKGIVDPPDSLDTTTTDVAPELMEKGVCVLCWDQKAEMALVPCGHVCLCTHCCGQTEILNAALNRQCPVCRTRFQQTLRVYAAGISE